MALRVQDQSPEVAAMAKRWPLVDALLGGTQAMRDAGRAYLLPETREDPADYEFRRCTATLFPALKRTISVMGGKPFAKALTLGDDVPEKIKEWCDDCDLEGRNLHTVASELFLRTIGYGLGGVLVDYPVTIAPDGTQTVKTLADEAKTGVRPYIVQIKHGQILGWKTAKAANGTTVLTMLRIAETTAVDDGAFGVETKDRVRVLEPGKWTLYEKQDKSKDEYTQIDAGTTAPLKVIPFVPFYGTRLAFMCGVSPLMELADLNVKHWQHQSDQDDSARFARKRLLVFAGMTDDSPVISGSGYAINLPINATATVVQGSAESVTVGRSELDALEQQMIQTGAELLVQKPGAARTATESSQDAEGNKSDLQRIVESFEDSLDQVLTLFGAWVGIPEDQTGHVSLFKDFSASTLSDASAQLVLAMQAQGLITKKTAIIEQQRRGMLSPDIDPEDELAEAEAEGPPLGTLGGARLDQPIEPKPVPDPMAPPAPKPAPAAA